MTLDEASSLKPGDYVYEWGLPKPRRWRVVATGRLKNMGWFMQLVNARVNHGTVWENTLHLVTRTRQQALAKRMQQRLTTT